MHCNLHCNTLCDQFVSVRQLWSDTTQEHINYNTHCNVHCNMRRNTFCDHCMSVRQYKAWRRVIGCLMFQVISCNKATNHRALWWKMTYKDKECHACSPPCSSNTTQAPVKWNRVRNAHLKTLCNTHGNINRKFREMPFTRYCLNCTVTPHGNINRKFREMPFTRYCLN